MLYLRGSTWWLEFKHAGVRHRFSTGETSRPAAEAAARRIRIEVEDEIAELGDADPGDEVTVGILEELHIERLRNKGATPRRIATVRNLWRNLVRHLGSEREVMTMTAVDLERYEGWRRAEKWQGENIRGQTIRRERQAFMFALRLAYRDKLIPKMPITRDDIDPVASDTPRESQHGKLWPDKTIAAVFKNLSPKALFRGHLYGSHFIKGTGLRFEEFQKFDMQWVEVLPRRVGEMVAVLHVPADAAKTGDPRDLPLTKSLLNIAKRWGHRFHCMDLSPSLKRASEKVGLELSVTPRDLRVWFLSHVDDPLAAQRLGGHRNIATTGLYLKAERKRVLASGVAVAKKSGAPQRVPTANRRRSETVVLRGARSSGG